MEASLLKGVPVERVPIIVASHTTRIKFKGENTIVAIFAATLNKTLEIFADRRLITSLQLPFADCKKLLHLPFMSSNYYENFVVALSKSSNAAILDLHSGLVVKNWSNIEDIEVEDELCIGYPQVILTATGFNQTRSAITPEYSWEPQSIIDCKEKIGEKYEDVAVHSVVNALENQLKNANNEVHMKENQLLLRKSLLSRSLSALSRSIKLQTCKSRAPSYTIRFVGDQDRKRDDMNINLDAPEDPLPIKTSEIWQVIDIPTGTWIIATAFINSSEHALTDISCALVIKSLDVTYRIVYITGNHKESGRTLPLLNSFSGTLEQGEHLFVAAVTSIPEFLTEEVEIASLFLTCNFPNRPNKLFQCSLGNCQISFKEVGDGSLGFNHLISQQPMPHEHLYGLLSILSIEESYSLEISEKGELSSSVLFGISKKLQLHYDPNLRCYYNFGFYSHVAILVLEENESVIKISIRTLTCRDMNLFVRQLRSSLDAGITLTFTPPKSPTDDSPQDLLTAGMNLLSGGRVEEPDEPMEVTEQSPAGNSEIDKIRRAFLRKHDMLIDTSRGHGSHILIPNALYCKWQEEYFAFAKKC